MAWFMKLNAPYGEIYLLIVTTHILQKFTYYFRLL